MKPFLLLFAISAIFASESVAEKPVHLFVLSGQSNMAGMDPETGFMTDAKKLFKDEKVVYIKVAKGGQPICRWLEEWHDIAQNNGLDENHIKRIHKGGKVEFYQPILDQYKGMLKKHPEFKSVTFCWMQGERDANGGAHAAYKDALKQLISNLRRDLKRPDMNVVIGRIGDYALDRESCVTVRKVQTEIANEDPHGAWVDVDDLNDRMVNGKMQSVVHYNRPEGYDVLGQRFAHQGYALIKGKKPAKNGRPQAESQSDQSDLRVIGAEAKPLKDSKPNIIVIMPDDIGYGDIASLGNPVVQTPNIDSLKRESLLFTQYHVSARCSPSRAVLMGGRHEFMSGVTHTQHGRERLSLDTVTLAQGLKSAGYTTGHFGKWHIGREKPYRPENRGFDESYGIEGGGTPKLSPRIYHNGVRQKKKDGYATDMFFEKAFAWMDEKRKEDAPFFAYIAPNDPHGPFTGLHSVPGDDYKKYLGKHPAVNEDTAKVYWMVENIDRHVGTLLSKLEEWQIAENTLLIYIGSDNGNSTGWRVYNAGMKGHKGQPYQGGTRVPIFFRWPAGKIPADAECSALTSQMDMMPTLLEITGAPMTNQLKKQVEGRSLVPMLKNPKTDWEDDRHLVHHVGAWEQGQAAQSKHARVSIQNKRFTLVNNEELYDLSTDPGETKNIIAEHPKVVNQLRKTYDKWWFRMQPGLVNEDAYKPPAE
ncbi:MAG: sulfatase-like hydrolase/transferase [Opitutae bacterium]|nr:sulfatase-like hydrolase/transferase [Opitutae bacterium]